MRRLTFNRSDWQAMRDHAERCVPEEACGLVGGKAEQANCIFPITNELHSPVRFRMLPEEQLKAMLLLEDTGLDFLAVYHSHPTGLAEPSPTDVKEFYYPGTVMIIWFRSKDRWNANGFEIIDDTILSVSLTIHD